MSFSKRAQTLDRKTRVLILLADVFLLTAIGIFTMAVIRIEPPTNNTVAGESKPVKREARFQIVLPCIDQSSWIKSGIRKESLLVNARYVHLIPMLDGRPLCAPIKFDTANLTNATNDDAGFDIKTDLVAVVEGGQRFELSVSIDLPSDMETADVSVLVRVETPVCPPGKVPTNAMLHWEANLPTSDSTFPGHLATSELTYPHAKAVVLPDAEASVMLKTQLPHVSHCLNHNHGCRFGVFNHESHPGCENLPPASSLFETGPLTFYFIAHATVQFSKPSNDNIPAVALKEFSFLPSVNREITAKFGGP